MNEPSEQNVHFILNDLSIISNHWSKAKRIKVRAHNQKAIPFEYLLLSRFRLIAFYILQISIVETVYI